MDLFKAIENRHAYNGFHTSQVVTKEELEKLLTAFNRAPSQFNSQPWKVVILQDKKRIKKLAKYCGDAMRISMQKGEFWKKYGKYFYHDPDNKKIKSGMGMRVDNIPKILKKVINYIVSNDSMKLIREKGVPSILGAENRKLVEKSPACIAIFLRKEDFKREDNTAFYSTLSLGMAIENMWLVATSLNIGMQFMSMPMEVPKIWNDISQMIECPDDYEMVALMRLGHKPKIDARPVLDWTSPDRLTLSDWTSNEVFR